MSNHYTVWRGKGYSWCVGKGRKVKERFHTFGSDDGEARRAAERRANELNNDRDPVEESYVVADHPER